MHKKFIKDKYPVRTKPIYSRAVPGDIDVNYEQRLKQAGFWADYRTAEKSR